MLAQTCYSKHCADTHWGGVGGKETEGQRGEEEKEDVGNGKEMGSTFHEPLNTQMFVVIIITGGLFATHTLGLPLGF